MSTTESKNSNLQRAKSARNDEFYTRLEDIEKELRYYSHHFKDKTVFLNCDDPYESDFFKYFAMNFEHLGLKKLISVSYASSPLSKESYKVEITEVPDFNGDGVVNLSDVEELLKMDDNTIATLKGDGDFRSDESVELLKQSDIIVTNPPFSLFREFISQLIEYDKKFVVLGNMNAITYKEVWPLIQGGQLWLGVTRVGVGQMYFKIQDYHPIATGQIVKDSVRLQTVGNTAWFTNLDHARRNDKIALFRLYRDDPAKYPNYDNFVGIEVSKVADIPMDFYGPMGVPITFLGKYNPDQFEILGYSRKPHIPEDMMLDVGLGHGTPYVGGKAKYDRIFIRRK